jgi:hypothetical protein
MIVECHEVFGLCTYALEAGRKAATQSSYSFGTSFVSLSAKHMNVSLDLNYSRVHCRRRS